MLPGPTMKMRCSELAVEFGVGCEHSAWWMAAEPPSLEEPAGRMLAEDQANSLGGILESDRRAVSQLGWTCEAMDFSILFLFLVLVSGYFLMEEKAAKTCRDSESSVGASKLMSITVGVRSGESNVQKVSLITTRGC